MTDAKRAMTLQELHELESGGGLRRLAQDAATRELMRPFAPLFVPGVTELVVNRPGFALTEAETGWVLHEVPELDYERLMSFATAVATFTRQDISAQRPILSAVLPNDERIQIVVTPAVSPGSISITIRRPDPKTRELEDYRSDGLFEETVWVKPAGIDGQLAQLSRVDRKLVELLEARDFVGFLAMAVEAHKNIAATGDTGSGKTTITKSLCRHIAPTERIVTIEDVRELFLPHLLNVVHLLYSKGGQGQAKVTPADLIASAMRMKPDRVLLAELRGAEAYDFLKLLTTGHEGSMTSYHASNVAVAPERFALMAKEHPEAAAYPDAALKRLFHLTIDVVFHVEARPVFNDAGDQVGKRRRMTAIDFNPLRKIQSA